MVKKGKGKGKKKKKKEVDPNILNEVQKTFYELEIADINKKIDRLSQTNIDLIEQNLEYEDKILKLDSERSDVIAALTRTLQEKLRELAEAQERLACLIENNANANKMHEKEIEEMKAKYEAMRAKLIAEIKLVTSKLNTLELFRMQRDELFLKYEEKERFIEEQEIKHKKMLYDIERKFIMGKDAVKREMEKQLFEMAADFEKVNEIRTSATTHRIIRENIKINNEIVIINDTNKRLETENCKLKDQNINLVENTELYQSKRNNVLSEVKIHCGVEEQLKRDHTNLCTELDNYNELIAFGKQNEKELKESLKREDILQRKVRVLEQNFHVVKCQDAVLKTEVENAEAYLHNFKSVMYEAIMVIKSALNIETEQHIKQSIKIAERDNLLNNLLSVLMQTKDEVLQKKSRETITSATEIYKRGDLGFEALVHKEKRPPLAMFHVESQIGKSFEDILKSYAEMIEEEEQVEEEVSVESEVTEYSETPKVSLAELEDTVHKETERVEEEAMEQYLTEEIEILKSKVVSGIEISTYLDNIAEEEEILNE